MWIAGAAGYPTGRLSDGQTWQARGAARPTISGPESLRMLRICSITRRFENPQDRSKTGVSSDFLGRSVCLEEGIVRSRLAIARPVDLDAAR